MAAADGSAAAGGGGAPEGGALPVPAAPDGIYFGSTWGPPMDSSQFEQFDKLPFRMFPRYARIGRAADFGGFLRAGQRGRFARTFHSDMHSELDIRGEGEDGGEDFVRVDSMKAALRRPAPGARRQIPQRSAAPARAEAEETHRRAQGTSFNKRWARLNKARYAPVGPRGGAGGAPRIMREFSVKIQPSWLPLESADFAQFKGDKFVSEVPTASDVKWTGALEQYDEEYDRLSAKAPRKLVSYPDVYHFYKTASEDPVLAELASEGVGNVIATDSVLSHLMACTRSVYPWDVVISYAAGTIQLDVQDPRVFDLHAVAENAPMPPNEMDPEDINGRFQLSLEATRIQQNFSQQVLLSSSGARKPDAPRPNEPVLEENPLWDPEEAAAEEDGGATTPAAGAFRYRVFKFPPPKRGVAGAAGEDISLVARTTVHGVIRKRAGAAGGGAGSGLPPAQFVSLFSLNEWDPKLAGQTSEWRKDMDSQRSNVLAGEMKASSFKLAKMTASALLAGTDAMRLGFVSRASRGNPAEHVLLGTQQVQPASFASASLALPPGAMWGVIRWIVERVRVHAANLRQAEREKAAEDRGEAPPAPGSPDPDADKVAYKFVLLRDPASPRLHLYNVPLDTFEEAEGEGEEEEGDGEEEEAAWVEGEDAA